MNGMNQLFVNDPVWFLQHVLVDNRFIAANFGLLNQNKAGLFDLVITGGNTVRLTDASPGTGHQIQNDVAIPAYWCPFLPGGGLPGWVDVPRFNPQRRFVFTAAMQGCALVVTDSPASPQLFRLSHNQHPGAQATWTAMQQIGITAVVSTLSWAQYGNQAPAAPVNVTNAFNFLWRPPGQAWSYIAQSNRLVPLAMGMRLERDPAMPLLNLPAGV